MRLEDEIAETYFEYYDFLPPEDAVQAVAQDLTQVEEEKVAEVLKRRVGLDFSRTRFEGVGKYSTNLKDELIKLGSEKPELQKHIRPVLDRISS